MLCCMITAPPNLGAALLAAWVEETSQMVVAAQIGRSQSQVSRYCSGDSSPEYPARKAALERRGIPLDAWDLPVPETTEGLTSFLVPVETAGAA